jgi:outer membrane protein assembly factor BamE
MRARIFPLLVLLSLAGCSSIPSLLYKIEIQQGNVITQDMVDKLRPGMSRSQVRFVLGSPLISDAFHDNRWDYVYRLEQKGRLVEQRKLTVFFDGDKLVRMDGTFSPSIAFAPPPPAEPASPAEELRNVVKEGAGASAPVLSSVPPNTLPGLESAATSPVTAAPQAAALPQAPAPGGPGSGEGLVPPASAEMPGSGQAPVHAAVLPHPGDATRPVAKEENRISASSSAALSRASTRSARQVPSQALDTGEEEADQPKE